MVKGVNKTVIEVNNTGSRVFDRIVFYVNPSCGNLNARHLNKAMQNFTFQFDERAARGYKTLRQRMLIRRRTFLCSVVAVVVAAVITITTLLL